MTGFADLEISIDRERSGTYAVSVRYRSPESDAEATDIWENQGDIVFDVDGFRRRAADVAAGIEEQTEAYSRALGEAFFGIEPIGRLFDQRWPPISACACAS